MDLGHYRYLSEEQLRKQYRDPCFAVKIKDYAFEGHTALETIELPNEIAEIGRNAFEHCTSLNRIEIPHSVSVIEKETFMDCTSLTEVVLNNVVEIRDDAFKGCTSLKSVTANLDSYCLPETLEMIGEGAFSGCTSLESINLGFVKSIGSEAFQGCTSLREVGLPQSGSIGPDAFLNCHSLRTVVIPHGIKEIGDSAFYGCDWLEYVEIPDSVEKIGFGAFSKCPSLKEFRGSYKGIDAAGSILVNNSVLISYASGSGVNPIISGSITAIGDCAFQESKLSGSIRIPSTVKIIGADAFDGCAGLEEAVIGESTEIDPSSSFPDYVKVIRKK